MTNILQAIYTIINNPIPDLVTHYKSKSQNRINSIGEALEEFIKDSFADTIYETNPMSKLEKYSQFFSYIGNQNNPPDLMIKNGDAVEVKKLQSLNSSIALNSSYPQAKLYQDSPMITSACRHCESWTEKDIIYAIGIIQKQNSKEVLKLLWLIYGDCYAATKDIYERIRQQIAIGINQIPGVEFSITKELGRVNKVDPLGITYLRIRGMWGIENPLKVFNYTNFGYDISSKFQLVAVLSKDKYSSLPQENRAIIENISKAGFSIQDSRIKSPDNPALLIPVKIISYKLV